MIRYVKAADLDTDKWDACVHRAENGLVYSTSWYLDILGEDWDALVLNDYEAVMPLVYRSKYSVPYIFRPTGVQQLGLTGEKADDPDRFKAFLEAIPSKYKLMDVFTNSSNAVEELDSSWKKSEQVNLLLELEDTYEGIYRRFSSQTKRNLKKAQKQNFKIFEYDPPEVLIRLFKENQANKYSVSDDFYQKMTHLMHVLIHKKAGRVWTIHDEHNSATAGAFIMEYKGRATLLFTATDEFGRDTHALTYLINEYLVYQSGHLKCFDFEGSNVPGIRKFYAGFGAREDNYYHLRKVNLPLPFRWLF
ncbi:hypothetical protein [Phaeocystidibacter marisrubri]|uniref:GNAT family N-acetyltransferase n=1 Tax=Phaeocystidibacter marisrubri TaxID=1577780 RepID=A0A6L3ZCW2_9FLAO|nr:hypothetical protein [Phaeocystidibacter marisrubri]KAB2815703.1 hypothetical protein F8C82_08355 [Phaeocystidibacter marisrubri]GGH65267.1 hypothetical protein GCM10011318_02110 [Phaeocystidibacter marisrubri]